MTHVVSFTGRRRWAPLRHAAEAVTLDTFRIVCTGRMVADEWRVMRVDQAKALRWGVTCEKCRRRGHA